ncbi:MAG: thiamine diphosphokinase [Spirochaetales bacterium]|nr:thiamine diphosphokinase [Spirochaetales bacterium]
MVGILITGGEKPPKNQLKTIIQKNWIVIAADSGMDYANEAGIEVSYCVGDMDSIMDESVLDSMEEEQVIRFPKKKDDTDTEIGLRMLQERGCGKTIIWGAGGGRMDHFLAVYSLFDRENAPDEWYTAMEHMVLIDGRFRSRKLKDKRISLFPLGSSECRMTSLGLKWSLDELVWNKGDFGISNIVDSDELEINMKTGKILMIYDIDGGNRP